MKKFHRNILVGWATLAAGSFIFAADNKPAREPRLDDYKVLWEQNMFLKDRRVLSTQGTRRGTSDDPRTRGPQRTQESMFALRGVALEEGTNYAYFEDMGTGKMLRLAQGETIARGRVALVDIDAVAYESNGQTTWVVIGTDLQGKAATSTEPPRISSTPTPPSSTARTTPATADSGATGDGDGTGTAATAPAAASDPATMSLEEKMKLRRQQGK